MDQKTMCNRYSRAFSGWILVICFSFVLCIAHTLYGQNVKIERTDLYFKNETLYLRLHVAELFDINTESAIASGMSQKYNLQFQLFDEQQNLIRSRPEKVTLRYDVWERIYHLEAAGKGRKFADHEKFRIFVTDSMEFRLGTVQGIDQQVKLRLLIMFSRQELSEHQRRELRTWITEETESGESQPAVENDQSFSINISKLLSIFFSRRESTEMYIYRSALFTLNSLSKYENSAQ